MPDLDRSLLSAVERGDREALERLARMYAAPVYRYLVRLSGDATLAEDLAQETAVQLWRFLPGRRFPNDRALNAWIYTVATNAFRMHRRRKRASEVSWDSEIELPAEEDSDPELAAQRVDLALRVRAALTELPEAERQALTMKVFGDLRYGEISAATGEPIGTVKWRISRAYARLRQLLQHEVSPGEGGHEPVRETASVPGRRGEPARSVAHGASPAALPGLLGAKGR